MKLSRRQLLLAGLGAAQVGLLDRMGMNPLRIGEARAEGVRPTKLLCLYVRGGWIPTGFFTPLGQEAFGHANGPEAPTESNGDPASYNWEQAVNCDGSGHAEAGRIVQRMRIPQLWDEPRLRAGQQDGRVAHPATGKVTVNHGWSWMQHELWKRTCVLHGIDQGTAAHNSGIISALCGAAGSEFRAPAMPAVVANAFFDAHASKRALPAVLLTDAPDAASLALPGRSTPIRMAGIETLKNTLSRRSDYQWDGFRDLEQRPDSLFDGTPLDAMRSSNGLDEFTLAGLQAVRGKAGAGADSYFGRLYDTYSGVSKTLSRDVLDVLEAAPGIDTSAKPFWLTSQNWGPFGVNLSTNVADSGGRWNGIFDMAMRLLQTDMSSCVSVRVPGIADYGFDTHGSPAASHFVALRATMEVIGRFLGMMSTTPASSGAGSVLDETLVCIFSEFSRTWPNGGDHWPYTSVALVGGGVRGNQMIGNYDLASAGVGLPVKLREEDGAEGERVPRSADVCSTIYNALGIKDYFIPGGYGEILGACNT